MDQIRWGIIGAGDVVEHKSGPAILQREGCALHHVMRRNAEAARTYAERHGVARWSTDAAEVLADPEVDIVYVATPPSSHAVYVHAAADARKHVLVEKPMATSAAEAEHMCAVCEAAGVELFVAYYRRFQPHVLHMKRLIEEGRLGKLSTAVVDIAAPTPAGGPDFWRTDPEISGGGIFVDIGSHRLDVLVSLLGTPVEIAGVAARLDERPGVEGAVSLSLRFPGGVCTSVTGDHRSGRTADRLELYGDKGSIAAAPLDGHVFSLHTAGTASLETHRLYEAPHYGLIAHVEAVLRGEEKNAVSGREGVETERMLDLVRACTR